MAFIAAACSAVDASSITFIQPQRGSKTAEFRIEDSDLKVTVEVKHLLKFPQGDRDQRWLLAFKRSPPAKCRLTSRPEEEVFSKIDAGLERTEYVIADELPWQKMVPSINEVIAHADAQLENARTENRIIVLYSDDPHTLTRDESNPAQEKPSENRIEKAVSAATLHHADAVVVVGSPYGFPIASGHAWWAYPADSIPDVVERMFGCLPLLHAADIRPFGMGLRVDLEAWGQREVRLPPDDGIF